MKKVIVGIFLLTTIMGPKAFAADTATGFINLSGNVPEIFQMQVRGYPGEMDLNPGAAINGRGIGVLAFRYNVSAASLTLSSPAGASGNFEAGGADYTGMVAAPTFGVSACATSSAAAATVLPHTAGLTAAADDLVVGNAGEGIPDDNCEVTITYATDATKFPVAGIFTLPIVVTFVSD